MSLNFDLTKVPHEVRTYFPTKEHKKNNYGFRKPKTEALILLTMYIDLPEITKKTVDEFWWRIQFLHVVDATYFSDKALEEKFDIPCSPWEIKKQDIIDHIGLKTNISKKTRHQFCLKYLSMLKDRVDEDSSYPQGIKDDSEEAQRFDAAYETCIKNWEENKQSEATNV